MSPSPALRRAARIIRTGGVIAYPTEAVFGLGCDPSAVAAVRRIIRLKGRSARAGLILIAGNASQLAGWIAPTAIEQRCLASSGSAPVTWVVTAGPRAHRLLTGGRRTLAVRITTHPIAAALCLAAAMPLVSTSANRHRRPPARTALAVRRRLGPALDFVLAGPAGPRVRPSEIRDARSGALLRRG